MEGAPPGSAAAGDVRRITLVIHSLVMGGAQRVATRLANHWVEAGMEVTLCTLAGREVPPFFELHPAVKLEPLGIAAPSSTKLQALASNASRVLALRKAIRRSRPELVVSFLTRTNILTLLAGVRLGVPIVASEATDPMQWNHGWTWRAMRRLTYPLADTVVALSTKGGEFYRRFLRAGRVRVVPNPVSEPAIAPDFERLARNTTIIAMGRLVHLKRFDLLIDAFAALSQRFPQWDLLILGEGPLRGELQARVARHALEERIHLPGVTADPEACLRRASIFVCSSDIEGFPMALCEAMACGLAVITTRYHDDVGEIVKDGVNGCLVRKGSAKDLETALDLLMSRRGMRTVFGRQAANVAGKYGEQSVMAQWDEVIRGLVSRD
ncbi:MAG: glycosyltransferase family 4 protein [Arenicellales bacterium]